MRLKMRCDWTGDPPGEFTTIATVGSLETLNALSIGPATEASARPGRKGVTMPIGPEKRSTGTTGPRLKKRIGQILESREWTRARSFPMEVLRFPFRNVNLALTSILGADFTLQPHVAFEGR